MNKHDKNIKTKREQKRNNKIKSLKNEQKGIKTQEKTNVNIDTTNVINKSSEKLTKYQLQVLSKGLKFAKTPKTINVVDIISNVESSLCTIPKIT